MGVVPLSNPPKAVAPEKLSHRAQWAAFAIRKNLGRIQNDIDFLPGANLNHLCPAQDTLYSGNDQDQTFRVGIVGAGAAGLFTAMIFDFLKEKFDLKVEYEILEANSEERLGGRLYSYYFKDIKDHPKVGPHDYYDVGAMRFPEIDIMKRTFELFKVLSMEKNDRTSHPPVKGELIPYHLNGRNQPLLYNGVQITTDGKKQPTAKDFNITDLPPDIINRGAGDLVSDTIKKYTEEYKKRGPEEFWKLLIAEADPYSVRQYLTLTAKYDYNTIEFLETLNFGNRWYDQAVSEMILESLDFDATAPWWCVEGGTQEIAERMRKSLQKKRAVEFGKTVSAMSYVGSAQDNIDVTVKGEKTPRRYDAVFNSVPLGAMQHMQLEGLHLNWGTKSAIRSLGYGASCKVGIRFRSLWWIKVLEIDQGGQGKTDLPIRCCVYPSYNIHDPVDSPGVLLVSYTWSQEAERIGALISRDSPEGENELKEVLFHDLARLHAKTDDDADYRRLYQIIEQEYLSHYAYNWYANPHSVGAFAFFGPGQFQNMYQWVTRSDGKHIIIGEAASAHHAWVVGALESAVRGVYQFLWKHSKSNKAASLAAQAYAADDISWPYGPLPAEYDRTADIKPLTVTPHLGEAQLPSPIGELARLQVVVETIRMEQGGEKVDPENITKKQMAPVLNAMGARQTL